MSNQPPFTHTRALLNHVFTTFSKSRTSSTISQPQARVASSGPVSVELGTKSLSSDSNPSISTSSEESGSEEGSKSSTGASSVVKGADDASNEVKIQSVIAILEDEAVDEEDRPEMLKELLSSLLVSPDAEPMKLDPLILALLHRHLEDVSPSGSPLPPFPSTASLTTRPTISRSSSFRRAFTPTMSPVHPPASAGGGAALSSSVSSTSSRSTPSSPFRPASPAASKMYLSPSSTTSPSHSPWSSPRFSSLSLTAVLSAGAPEFKLSSGASEFRPGSSNGGTNSPGGSQNGRTSTLSAQQAQANWAFTSSPLGTPKYSAPPSIVGGSNASSPSYFPRTLGEGLNSGGRFPKKARLPWAEAGDTTDDDDEEDDNAGMQVGYPRVGEEEYGQQAGFDSNGQWDPFASNGSGHSGGYGGGYTPNYEEMEGDPQQEGDGFSFDFTNSYEGSTGLGGMGAYSMTPFDVLHSVFAGSDVSAAVLEEALVMSGWDIDQAIEYIIDTQPGGPDFSQQGDELGPSYLHPQASPPPPARIMGGSGSRPLIVSRDSFEGYLGGNGGRGGGMMGQNQNQNQQWQGRNSPGGNIGAADPAGRGVGGRVCRYYLSGNCLRSDCKFSHDVGKAVCKFWLRGHCLKGEGGRCDFLHSIPPIMRADYEQRAQRRSAAAAAPLYDEEYMRDEGPDLDFPTLGAPPRAHRQVLQHQNGRITLDPTRTRFSGAVKFGRNLPTTPLPRTPPVHSARESLPQARHSARLNLRPPALLPTLPTGAALAALYVRYRSSFLELGANRNKCLARAAECWKRGDGAGAKNFSREAQSWNRQVAIEGRDSANRIVEERKKLMKEALARNENRAGSTDDVADRKVRGKERGGGVCLGVVSAAVLARGERALTSEERTEVALDLHGLHADEAVSFIGDFLQSLERERYSGIAYVVIGQGRHSGGNDPGGAGAAAGRLRLEQACSEFLANQGWAWNTFGGILAVDALR